MAKTKTAKPAPTSKPVGLTPQDVSPNETSRRLSAAQIRAIVNMTHFRAMLMRDKGAWSPAEEEAFLNGAMSALLACCNNTEIPVYWVMNFGPERLLDKLERWKREGKKLDYQRGAQTKKKRKGKR